MMPLPKTALTCKAVLGFSLRPLVFIGHEGEEGDEGEKKEKGGG